MIDDLLELAEHLAQKDANKPKQLSLRRSASTAYYAMFHALARMSTDALVGWSKPWNIYTPVYRSLDHGTAKRFFKSTPILGDGTDVAPIGKVFIWLQEVRHEADYDPKPFRYGRRQALELCESSRVAVDAIRALPTETKLLLAVGLIMKSK